ncbi:MAG: hypothetical protein V8T46_04130 [Sutterella seckii]
MSSMLIRNAHAYVRRGHFEEALLIEDGIIRAVGSKAALRKRPADVKVLDAQGKTIVPGFINSHSTSSTRA